jgi:DNA-binding NarL/FixJ family response regulator
MKPRLLLADDHTLLLEGIRLMLEPEFDLVGSVEDGQALLAAAKTLKPDVILLDISMPLLNGIDAARRLRNLLPSARLIFVTMHAGADYVAEAFRAGAMGYLLKRSAASELITAIRTVLKGNHYVSPLVTRNALEVLILAAQNLITDPPFTKMDIISCRNLLIYVDAEAQGKLVPLFNYSLNTGGISLSRQVGGYWRSGCII